MFAAFRGGGAGAGSTLLNAPLIREHKDKVCVFTAKLTWSWTDDDDDDDDMLLLLLLLLL